MPNQNDYEKVKACVIDPLCKLYGAQINEYATEAIVEDLCGFDHETLAEAMRLVRREQKRTPSLAHLIEACREAKATLSREAKKAKGEKKETGGYNQTGFVVREVMESPVGQLALSQGVGHDVWIRCWVEGKRDFSEADVKKYALDLKESAEALAEARRTKNAFVDALEGVYHALRESETRLYDKYFKNKLGFAA